MLTWNLHCHWHDDIIKWKIFSRYWAFVRVIHRSPVNSPHKGQWRSALMLSLICAWINGWVNSREADDLRCHHAHYDVTVMAKGLWIDLPLWHDAAVTFFMPRTSVPWCCWLKINLPRCHVLYVIPKLWMSATHILMSNWCQFVDICFVEFLVSDTLHFLLCLSLSFTD